MGDASWTLQEVQRESPPSNRTTLQRWQSSQQARQQVPPSQLQVAGSRWQWSSWQLWQTWQQQENKTPSDCCNKAFKPCLVHGPKSKHTSEECHKNPKKQQTSTSRQKASLQSASQGRVLHEHRWWAVLKHQHTGLKWGSRVSLKQEQENPWGWELSSSWYQKNEGRLPCAS